MLAQILATVARHRMIVPGQRILAAVSGGPDSICLLHVLHELAPQIGFTLAGVAHVNHNLRGAESDEDERFVAQAAARLRLPFYALESLPDPSASNLEQSLRRARKAFFRETLAAHRADRIALGHTRDDQAETVLFRLLRGSGLAGLAGILPITADGLIRPLLDVRREQVLAYLTERHIPWREDSSNRSPRFARNRIRRSLLPKLAKDWNPRIVDTLAQTADLAYQEELWWAQRVADEAAELLSVEPNGIEMEAARLASLPPSLARRVVRHAIRRLKGTLAGVDYAHVETVLDLARRASGSGSASLPGLQAERSFGFVWLFCPPPAPPPEPLWIAAPGSYQFGNSLISIEFDVRNRGSGACVTLGVDLAQGVLELRTWKSGDRYQPEGTAREQKLKDLFQKARVPSWRRASWPILLHKGKILWAKQFGVRAGSPEFDDELDRAGRPGAILQISCDQMNLPR